MKKFFCFFLVVIVMISMCCCGQPDHDTSNQHTSKDNIVTTDNSTTDTTSNNKGNSKGDNKETVKDESKTQSSSSNNNVSNDSQNQSQTSSKTETSNNTESSGKTSATSSSTESNVTVHTHKYTSTIISGTCATQGYTEYKCNCGSSYKDNYTSKTHAHDFIFTQRQFGGSFYEAFVCRKCDIEALNHGNADGSLAGVNNKVKYYVTYTPSNNSGMVEFKDYHIVIYGNGAMPDFSSNNYPVWRDYLSETTKITVAQGVTSIGSYAFNYPNGRTQITFNMADSVKTIKANSINLNMKSIVLGKGVERIEDKITGKNMTGIYIPKTLKYFGALGNSWNTSTTIFYEGTKEEFLNITTRHYNKTVTVKTVLDDYFSSDVYSPYCHVYLKCSKIFDRTNYFDMM